MTVSGQPDPATPDGVALFRYALFTQTPRVWVTPLLVALNVAVFLAMVGTGVSLMSPSVESLLKWGADYAPRTTAGEWWRLISNTFVHVGLVHIAMNMIGLWQIGGLVERLLGHRAFVLVYLVSGLCGSLASITWHPFVVSAGASGAVFGVYGVLMAYLVRHRGSIPREVLSQLQRNAIFFIGVNIVFGLQVKGIDMAAHIGGLLGGFGAALLVARPVVSPLAALGNDGQVKARRGSAWPELLVAALALALFGAAVMLLPRTADVQGALEDFQAVERQSVDAFNDALERRRSDKLSDDDLARIVDQQVLPPWRAYQQRLASLRDLPPAEGKRMANLGRYLALREQGWIAFSEALRTNSEGKAKEAQALQRQAEQLMKTAVAPAED